MGTTFGVGLSPRKKMEKSGDLERAQQKDADQKWVRLKKIETLLKGGRGGDLIVRKDHLTYCGSQIV